MWRSDGKNFSFDSSTCINERDGQGSDFDQMFDMYPTGTTHVEYDEDAAQGGYAISDGELVTEDVSYRHQKIKEIFDAQVNLVEGA